MIEYQDNIVACKFQRLLYDTYTKINSDAGAFSFEKNHSIFEEFKLLPDFIEGYPPKSDVIHFCFYCLKNYFEDVDPLSTPLSMTSLYGEQQIGIDSFQNDFGFLAIASFVKSQQEKEKITNNVKVTESMITPNRRKRI